MKTKNWLIERSKLTCFYLSSVEEERVINPIDIPPVEFRVLWLLHKLDVVLIVDIYDDLIELKIPIRN